MVYRMTIPLSAVWLFEFYIPKSNISDSGRAILCDLYGGLGRDYLKLLLLLKCRIARANRLPIASDHSSRSPKNHLPSPGLDASAASCENAFP
jgi:hypothetical protein